MPNDSTTRRPADQPTSLASTFKQLPRAPLVPEAVLKRHNAYCVIDTRFRAAARLQAALWLKSQNIATAADDPANSRSFLGSYLSDEAARAGKNFLSTDVHRLALQEWLLCEEDAAFDSERLFGNALSSMPVVFSVFGPLALDRKLATAVFRRLLPGFVRSVERIHFETSPGRKSAHYLLDRTALDLAVHVTASDRRPAIIYIEVKFSESMEGPAARMRDRYAEASRQVRLYRDPDSAMLRSFALEQLWREHMTAALAVENGVTPQAVFMAIAPSLNRRAQAAFRVYEAELIPLDQREADRVPFVPMTLEHIIQTIAAASATDLAQALWKRYCDFTEVYRLSMEEIAGNETDAQPAGSGRAIPASRPPARRATSSPARHRTRTASTATEHPT